VKVVTLVGTRPELIKLSLTIAELDRLVEHVLVHSGQNYDYELNEIFFNDLSIRKPDHFLDAGGGTAARTIARVIERFDAVLEQEMPHAVLVLGDTNSCLGVIAAKRRRIPIFHMEAGNRCFDARVPEETNRRIVDHISDINLTYTEHARRYLLAEGIRADTVIKTGSPLQEIFRHYQARIHASDARDRLKLDRNGYFLVSAHREENVDDPKRLQLLLQALDVLAKEYKYPIVFSTHPRTANRLNNVALPIGQLVQFIKPLAFTDYVALEREAFCVLSDSGTLTEESAILGFPAVMLREAHERPEGMDEAVVIMSGLQPERVCQAVQVVRSQPRENFRAPTDYQVDNVAGKVVRLILSYTDFVNRTTWYKT
jgi:UDP-N-acetylglucosamine 2-epimerase (non-hydrolysing)